MPDRRSAAAIEINGKKLYRVDVEERRTAVFYVLAENQFVAEVDAKVLGEEIDEWDDYETDISTLPARGSMGPEYTVWTGGEHGEFVAWKEIAPD